MQSKHHLFLNHRTAKTRLRKQLLVLLQGIWRSSLIIGHQFSTFYIWLNYNFSDWEPSKMYFLLPMLTVIGCLVMVSAFIYSFIYHSIFDFKIVLSTGRFLGEFVEWNSLQGRSSWSINLQLCSFYDIFVNNCLA